MLQVDHLHVLIIFVILFGTLLIVFKNIKIIANIDIEYIIIAAGSSCVAPAEDFV